MAPLSVPLLPEEWLRHFADAWRTHDAELVASLFTADGALYFSPVEPPVVGREAIQELWRRGTAPQSDCEPVYGEPLLVDGVAIVEWWATVKVDGEWTTEPGCALIRFADDGLCTEMREYSTLRHDRIAMPTNWLAR